MAVLKVKKGESIYDIAARTGQPVSKLFRYFGTDRPRKGSRYNTRTLAGMKAGTGQAWGRAVGQGATITGEAAGQAPTFADLLAQEAGLTPQPTAEETITATTQTTPTTTTTPPPLSFAPGGVQIRPGETFLDVANRLGVDVTDLLESNAGVRQLHPGTFLQIPRKSIAATPGAIGTEPTMAEKAGAMIRDFWSSMPEWAGGERPARSLETAAPATTGATPETIRPPVRSTTRLLDKEQMVTDRISTTPTLAGQPELYVAQKFIAAGVPPSFLTGNTANQLGYTKEALTMAGYYQDANGNWLLGGPQTTTTNLGGGTATRRRYASGGGRGSGGKTLYQGVVDTDFMWRASFRV